MSPLAELILKDVADITAAVDFNEIKDKTFLITGASGLIGHYLVATLAAAAEKGNAPKEVLLVSKHEVPEYFKDLTKNLNARILTGDVSDQDFFKSIPEADYIVHAAGYGQPGKFMIDPVKTLELNTLGTFETLKKLRPDGKYLFVSTSEVYSGLSTPPFKESQIGTTNTDHPRSCYIEGKRGGEVIVNAYRSKGVQAKSARLSLAYGPGTRKDDARVLNSFIKKALMDKKIAMMDHGEAKRTYMYITDAVEILFDILFKGKDALYNVGGTSRTTIKELAEMIGSYTEAPVTFPETESASAGAPDDVYLDMTKSETEFNKKNYLPLAEGLKKTIEWQKELYLLK